MRYFTTQWLLTYPLAPPSLSLYTSASARPVFDLFLLLVLLVLVLLQSGHGVPLAARLRVVVVLVLVLVLPRVIQA